MVTYPSTHGVFEESIKRAVTSFMRNWRAGEADGANMNAQVGLTAPLYWRMFVI